MKLVKISMELILPNGVCDNYDYICHYLNKKLYEDPEFFGEFMKENIIGVEDWE